MHPAAWTVPVTKALETKALDIARISKHRLVFCFTNIPPKFTKWIATKLSYREASRALTENLD